MKETTCCIILSPGHSHAANRGILTVFTKQSLRSF